MNLLVWGAATVVLLAIAWSYVPFVADDALISLRYSERLLTGQGLTYTDGERVEGYSNLLWVLIVAAGGWLTRDLILVGRIAGSICGALALAAVIYAAPIRSWRTAAPTLAGVATLALSYGLAIWSIGGLEQALQTALLAWALALTTRGHHRDQHDGRDRIRDRDRAWTLASVLLALLVLTRPDGALFCALIVAGLVVADGLSTQTLGRVTRLASIPALTWCGQLGFRLWYYGDWLPNTAYVKLSASAHHTREGAHYIASGLGTHAPMVALALIGLLSIALGARRASNTESSDKDDHSGSGSGSGSSSGSGSGSSSSSSSGSGSGSSSSSSSRSRSRSSNDGAGGGDISSRSRIGSVRRRDLIVPLVVALGWAAYVIYIGGDIFPGRRHFLPIVVCLAFLVVASWRASLDRWRWGWGVQAAALVIACGAYVALQRTDVENDRARTERWEWDCEVLASTLREAFSAQRPLVAADSVGCTGYFGKLPTLDMLGLTDRHIARSTPPGLGTGYIGHEHGDGRYVLTRQPDIAILCTPTGSAGGCFPSSAELSTLPAFAEQYRLIPIRNRRLFTELLVWVRRDSPRIGVIRSEREIRIPGFLFASRGGITARPAADGRLVALIPTDDVVTLNDVLDHDANDGTDNDNKNETDGNDGPSAPPANPRWTARAIASSPLDATIEGRAIRIRSGSQQAELLEVVLTR